MLLNFKNQLVLTENVSLWALEPDDKAIVGVWLLDGDYKDLSGNDNKGKETGDFKFGISKMWRATFVSCLPSVYL